MHVLKRLLNLGHLQLSDTILGLEENLKTTEF